MNVQHETSLEKAFEFTPDDLRENKQGRLSAAQAGRLRRIAQRMAMITIGVLGGLGILTIISSNPGSDEVPILFLFLIVPAAIIFAVTIGATEAALAPGVVAERSGIAHLAMGMFEYDPPLDPGQSHVRRGFMLGRYGAYSMIVGETEFRLPREQWTTIPPGAQVTIYFLPTIKKIVAVEIIDANIRLPEPPTIDIIADPVPRFATEDDDGERLKG